MELKCRYWWYVIGDENFVYSFDCFNERQDHGGMVISMMVMAMMGGGDVDEDDGGDVDDDVDDDDDGDVDNVDVDVDVDGDDDVDVDDDVAARGSRWRRRNARRTWRTGR